MPAKCAKAEPGGESRTAAARRKDAPASRGGSDPAAPTEPVALRRSLCGPVPTTALRSLSPLRKGTDIPEGREKPPRPLIPAAQGEPRRQQHRSPSPMGTTGL